MKTLSTGVRYLLTGLLLVVVWHHAHWSVTLCLGLCCLGVEVQQVSNHLSERAVLAFSAAMLECFLHTLPVDARERLLKDFMAKHGESISDFGNEDE